MMSVLYRMMVLLSKDATLDKCPDCGAHTGINARYCSECIRKNRQELQE